MGLRLCSRMSWKSKEGDCTLPGIQSVLFFSSRYYARPAFLVARSRYDGIHMDYRLEGGRTTNMEGLAVATAPRCLIVRRLSVLRFHAPLNPPDRRRRQ